LEFFMAPERAFQPLAGSIPVIGIAGGTGSGKSTISNAILQEIGPDRVTLISHDSYYRDRSDLTPDERANLNFDHPDSLETELLVEHLDRLVCGSPVELPVYDFVDHRRLPDTETVTPRRVVLVEGVLALVDAALRDRMALKIYVETDDDIRFIRRLQRDVSERGRSVESVISQYLATVRPMHNQFVAPSRSHADVIIPEGGYNARAIEMICSQIEMMASGNTRRGDSA
jgi:uridine kinase